LPHRFHSLEKHQDGEVNRYLAQRGLHAKEMLGGLEYWVREGLPVQTGHSTTTRPVDPLTAACGC
jgi:hypothetical protein